MATAMPPILAMLIATSSGRPNCVGRYLARNRKTEVLTTIDSTAIAAKRATEPGTGMPSASRKVNLRLSM
jgi:hypothetical protein